MIHKAVIAVTILITAGTEAGSLPEGVNVIPVPLIISDSLAFSLDESDPISDELFDSLGLSEFPNTGSHFTQYLHGKADIAGTPFLLLFFQIYTEEIYGWLISYSKDDQVIDWLSVYYWNSEGFVSRNGYVDTDGTIIVNEWLIDASGETTSIDTISLMENGFFGVTGSTKD
ncbi:MAG: hypothetical protein GQ565_13515 [Candidatus Aegiribacteria sp.]|nr:hypothetical protein [Candidatus Aegiribacteria sp.]